MKKFFIFIMTLIFILNFNVFAANDYSDTNEILYTTEVNIMTDLNIFEGDDNNNDGIMDFRPKDNVTREEAAKLISYMLLGKNSIERLPAGDSIFVDVANDAWSAKYINFCASRGIIKGRGQDIFDPKGNITGAEIATMLLRAVGYGKKGEYEGPGWDINSVSDALAFGIFDNTFAENFGDAVTREETALYFFNTMTKVSVVGQSADSNSYVVIKEPLATSIWNLDSIITTIIANQATGEKYTVTDFGNFDLETGIDKIAHSVKIWYNTDKTNLSYYKAYSIQDLSVTTTNAKTYNDLYKDAYAINPLNANIDLSTISVWENYTLTNNKITDETILINSLKNNNSTNEYKGTFVYDNEGIISAYLITLYSIDLVTNISEDNLKLKINGTIDNYKAYDNIAKGDYITLQKTGNKYLIQPTYTEVIEITERSASAGYFNYSQITPGTYATAIPSLGDNIEDIKVGDSVLFYFDYEGKYFAAKILESSSLTLNGAVFAVKSWVVDEKNAYNEIITTYYTQAVNEAGEEIIYESTELITTPDVYKVYTKINNQSVFIKIEDSVLIKEQNRIASLINENNDIYYITNDTNIYYVNNNGSNIKINKAEELQKEDSYNCYVTYTKNKINTIWVIGDLPIRYEDSYLFITDGEYKGTIAVDNYEMKYYIGYVDGIINNEIVIDTENTTIIPGFYNFVRNDNNVLTLNTISDSDIRTTILTDGDIYKNRLYKNADGISLNNIKIVNTLEDTIEISNIEELVEALIDYDITITYISELDGTPVDVIYIINIE